MLTADKHGVQVFIVYSSYRIIIIIIIIINRHFKHAKSLHWILIFRHVDFAHVLDFVDFVGRRQTNLINVFEIAP